MRLFAFLAAVFVCSLASDEEIGMTTPQIVKHWGYPIQIVKATTADGYVLTMHRIPYGKHDKTEGKRPVAFLQHGLECSSSNFITNLPEKALGFMMADSGFDVWMGNVRGNLYSMEHTTLNSKEHAFWEFTWQHMMKYDLTAMIDKALEVTNQSHVYYVGHSQGTLTMFAKLASEPKFGKKIRKFFALAPIGTVAHINGLMGVCARDFYGPFETFEKIFGENNFLPDSKFLQFFEKLLCTHPVVEGICDNFLFLIAGPESDQLNTTRVPVYITDVPSGTSTLNVRHWMQMVRANKVQWFDYEDEKENEKHYGQKTPPEFDYGKVDVDTYIYWGAKDWLADKQDVEAYLLKKLNPKILKENNYFPNYNHLDFIWGERPHTEIYRPIIEIIKADLAA